MANGHQQTWCKQSLDKHLGVKATPLGTTASGEHWPAQLGRPWGGEPGTLAGSLTGARCVSEGTVDSPGPAEPQMGNAS